MISTVLFFTSMVLLVVGIIAALLPGNEMGLIGDRYPPLTFTKTFFLASIAAKLLGY